MTQSLEIAFKIALSFVLAAGLCPAVAFADDESSVPPREPLSAEIAVLSDDAGDVEPPVLKGFSIDRDRVSSGEAISFRVSVEDDSDILYCNIAYKKPITGMRHEVHLPAPSGSRDFSETMAVDDGFEPGVWVPQWISISDRNRNSVHIYDEGYSGYVSSDDIVMDLSSLKFEVFSSSGETGLAAAASTERVSVDETAFFSCAVEGAGSSGLTYQWEFRTKPTGAWKPTASAGHNTPRLKVQATEGRVGWQYRCVVAASDGRSVTTGPIGFDMA